MSKVEALINLGRIVRESQAVTFADPVEDPDVLDDLMDILSEEIGRLDSLSDVSVEGETFTGKASQRIGLGRSQVYTFTMSPDNISYKMLNAAEMAEFADSDEGWQEIIEFAATKSKTKPKGKRADMVLKCKPGNTQCGGKCQSGQKKCNTPPSEAQKAAIKAAAKKAKAVTKKTTAKSKPAEPIEEKPIETFEDWLKADRSRTAKKQEAKKKEEEAIASQLKASNVSLSSSLETVGPVTGEEFKRISKEMNATEQEAFKLSREDRDDFDVSTRYIDNYSVWQSARKDIEADPETFRGVRDKDGRLQAIASVRIAIGGDRYVEYLATAPWNIGDGDERKTKGAGTAAMTAIIHESVTKGNGAVRLAALPGAISFYERMGFKKGEEDFFGTTDMSLSATAAKAYLKSVGVEFSEIDDLYALEEDAMGSFAVGAGYKKARETETTEPPSLED